MNAVAEAERTARRTAGHPALAAAARFGLAGFGVLHLLIAWLAYRIAVGAPAGEGDQSGALAYLAAQPMGRPLVGGIAAGLAAMALWQLLEAAVGHRGRSGARRTAERLVSAGRAVVYAYLGTTAVKVLARAARSGADQQQAVSARLMDTGPGRAAVVAAGVVVAAIGVGLAVYGVTRGFRKHLHTGRMTAAVRRLALAAGAVGYTAKGAAYALAGALLVVAGVTSAPARARGLDAALRGLADQPHGGYLLIGVAAGLATYGGYCFVQAGYRKV
ncbi:membrane protein [Pilimelia terevasa]|uniref:Membrane protein n=1 Tax=Pilimelia terevasa TaxID=53372 RepID=A0A8J3FLA7_9ACTN|nr:DUF1206 domain-containing protein [Pilimelia terevasa]GGK40304.1 membrane protein [Pilimelia terevasa]